MGFPGGSVVNNPPSMQETRIDMGSIPGSGRSPGGGNGNPLQHSCLENSMDRRAWWLQSMGSQRAGHYWVTNTIRMGRDEQSKREGPALNWWMYHYWDGKSWDGNIWGKGRVVWTTTSSLLDILHLWCLLDIQGAFGVYESGIQGWCLGWRHNTDRPQQMWLIYLFLFLAASGLSCSMWVGFSS